jgi:hypothetical protein
MQKQDMGMTRALRFLTGEMEEALGVRLAYKYEWH